MTAPTGIQTVFQDVTPPSSQAVENSSNLTEQQKFWRDFTVKLLYELDCDNEGPWYHSGV
jgi:hypothetical protein